MFNNGVKSQVYHIFRPTILFITRACFDILLYHSVDTIKKLQVSVLTLEKKGFRDLTRKLYIRQQPATSDEHNTHIIITIRIGYSSRKVK